MLLEEIYKNNKILTRTSNQAGLLYFGAKRTGTNLNGINRRIGFKRLNKITKMTVIRKAYNKFSNQTTIHGMGKWCNMSSDLGERLFWLVIFSLALIGCIYISNVLASRYKAAQTRTLIDQVKYPIFKVPFPEVTICHEHRLNWQRLNEARFIFVRKEHQTKEILHLFRRIMRVYDGLALGESNYFDDLEQKETLRLLSKLNYINFTDVVDYMAWRCDEIFRNCTWQTRPINCCDIFLKRRSQLGQCLAFNTVEGDVGKQMMRRDKWWPWRTNMNGPNSGLSLVVDLQETHKSQENEIRKKDSAKERAIIVMLVEPFVYFGNNIHIARNTRTHIILDPEITFQEEDTRRIASNERQCVFEDEFESKDYKTLVGHPYNFENCKSECQQEYLMKFCNCTIDLFYPPAKYPICKLVDLPCLVRYNYRFTYVELPGEENFVMSYNNSIKCPCLLSCQSIAYLHDTRSSSLSLGSGNATSSGAKVELDIYFHNDFLVVYRTSLLYTWVDLLASFGGIVALFLGCSITSLVELAYFQFIELPHDLLQQRGPKIQKVENLSNFLKKY